MAIAVMFAWSSAVAPPARAGVVTDVGGATVWFDAAQIQGQFDGAGLSQWDDMSGNGHSLIQGNPDNMPTYRDAANGLNNLPVVRFDGDPPDAGDQGDRMATFDVPTTDDFSVFLVWKMDDATGNQIPISKFNQSAKREWAFWLSSSTLRTSTSTNGVNRTDRTYAGVPAPTDDYAIDVVVKGGAAAPNWHNGVFTAGAGTVQTTLTPGANSPISLGTSFGATSSYLRGNIAEAIIYGRAINGGERAVVSNYLAAKWGRTLAPVEDFYTGDDADKGNYDFDVIGIGQLDGGKFAASQAAGLRVGELGASLDADGELVLAGHATATNSLTTAGVESIAGITERWERTWYVDGTGDVGAQLVFDFAAGGVAAPGGGDGFSLLYSADDALGFSVLATSDTLLNGNEVQFDLATGFADGYYTLALGKGSIAPQPMPDLNMDGKVDIFDVAIVSNNWANSGAPGTVAGDANKDGVVDIFDVALISNNWNPGGAAAVPEPASLVLLACGGLVAAAVKLRGRHRRD